MKILCNASVLWILLVLLCSVGSAGDIHEAARTGDIEKVKRILNEAPDQVAATDAMGMTALHWASRGVHSGIVQLLVAKGADVNARDKNNVIALHSVALRGNRELVELFLSKGADVDAKHVMGATPLHLAVQGGKKEIVALLIEKKARLSERDNFGNTPLLLASSYGYAGIAVLLIEKGANVNAKNSRGNTPLDVAEREGHEDISIVLRAKGGKRGSFKMDACRGDYLGQPRPDATPAIFAPGIVSTEQDQLNAVFSPDGKEFYFSIRNALRGFTIMAMKREGDLWTMPKPASFSRKYSDVDHFMTRDGATMFFSSNRPLQGSGPPKEDHDFWYTRRMESGWAAPQHMGPEINSEKNDFYLTMADSGTIYFSSHRSGGLGMNDIYCSKPVDGKYTTPKNLGPAVNTELREFDPFISPDESYIIFASERTGGLGGSDLYISFRSKDGTWSKAKNMGNAINSNTADLTPMLSQDGKYLFFTSRRSGVSDLYWVDAKIIETM